MIGPSIHPQILKIFFLTWMAQLGSSLLSSGVRYWVVCSTPHALSPDTLSPDVLSPLALSPHALSPNGLRNA